MKFHTIRVHRQDFNLVFENVPNIAAVKRRRRHRVVALLNNEIKKKSAADVTFNHLI